MTLAILTSYVVWCTMVSINLSTVGRVLAPYVCTYLTGLCLYIKYQVSIYIRTCAGIHICLCLLPGWPGPLTLMWRSSYIPSTTRPSKPLPLLFLSQWLLFFRVFVSSFTSNLSFSFCLVVYYIWVRLLCSSRLRPDVVVRLGKTFCMSRVQETVPGSRSFYLIV